tara:strand:+ start:1037 stop:1174 length:138 start_codon:yes stop_codon:yes gene_type:complete
MTEKTVHSFSVVPDEHVKKIAEKGITVDLSTKKDAKKEVVVDKDK